MLKLLWQGADLCHVFCEPGAGIVIKVIKPELYQLSMNSSHWLGIYCRATHQARLWSALPIRILSRWIVALFRPYRASIHANVRVRDSSAAIVCTVLKFCSKKESVKDIVERVTNVFTRLHVLVVGPGLSRDQCMQDSAKEIILKARELNMAIVLDAVCNNQ